MNSIGAVLFRSNSKLRLIKLKIPSLSSGQILVKMRYSSFCKSQIMEIDGLRGKDEYLPHLLGHEGSGEVVKVANDVKLFKPKDKVIISWIKTEGKDSNNVVYSSNHGNVNSGPSTTFNTFSIVAENRLIKKPKFLNYKESTFFGCAIPTGSGMVINNIPNNINKKILIIGMGGIGLSAIFSCLIKKYKNLVVLEISKKKIHNFKNKFPNSKIIFKTNFKDLEINYFDYIIDCSGSSRAINNSIKYLKNSGSLIFASHPKKGEKLIIDPHELIKGKKIIGTWGGGFKKKEEFNKLFKIYKGNKAFLNFYIEKQYGLKDINKAKSDFKLGKVTRPIIKF